MQHVTQKILCTHTHTHTHIYIYIYIYIYLFMNNKYQCFLLLVQEQNFTRLWLWALCPFNNFYNFFFFFFHQSWHRGSLSSALCERWYQLVSYAWLFTLSVISFKGLALDYAGFALQTTRLSQMLATMQMQLCSLAIFFLQKQEHYVCLPCEDDRGKLHASVADCAMYKYILPAL